MERILVIDANVLFSALIKEFTPKEKFEGYLEEAKEICSDKNDSPYVALSLSLGKAPIWSNDKELKEDCEEVGIKVLSTEEIKLLVV